ncbi:MAG: pirin family protein [Pseudomonadales bacterium]|nr:pirin family protein [Pseudomonadales bacterium]
MQAINTTTAVIQGPTKQQDSTVSGALTGEPLGVGEGFAAKSFRAREIGERMDPLVMVDHYVMTAPTFGAHPHGGMSAVSLLFEDSEGLFHNRDSLGNDFDLRPGDLYWLKAGSGAVHDESPRPGARIHGLQVFINVPQVRRFDAPESLLVRSEDMPVIDAPGARVKVALGESNGLRGAVSPSTAVTILDGTFKPGQVGAQFSHRAAANRGIWIQSVEGSLDVAVGDNSQHLEDGQAIALATDDNCTITVTNPSTDPVHFALFDGARIGEPWVQDGPFVMGSIQQISDIKAAYEAGQLGSISNNT